MSLLEAQMRRSRRKRYVLRIELPSVVEVVERCVGKEFSSLFGIRNVGGIKGKIFRTFEGRQVMPSLGNLERCTLKILVRAESKRVYSFYICGNRYIAARFQ